MNLRSRALATAFMTVLIAIPTVAGSAVAAIPASASWLSDVAESDQLTGPIVARGLLVDGNGRPHEGKVSIVAWPRPEIMETLKVGDSVKTAPVAKSSVGSDGAFALRVDPSIPLDEFMSPDGVVNFDLWAETSDGWSLFSFPRALKSGAQPAWVNPGSDASSKTAAKDVLSVTLRPEFAPAMEPASALTPAAAKACVNTVVATYNGRTGIVGETYSGPHSTADFQYTSGASSTLGVGYDVAGGSVTFSQSGTATWSDTSSIEWPTQAANKKTVYQTSFGYQNVKMQIQGSSGCIQQGNQVRPYRWDGAVLSYAAASAPAATNCSPITTVPATQTKNSGTAITFTNGLKIGTVIGIDLSLKTGFNTNTKIVHRFTSAGQLCGSNATWPTAARIVGK